MTLAQSELVQKMLYIHISFPSTASLGDKKYCLQVIDDRINHAQSYFSKEQSELKTLTVVLLKDLKATEDVDVSVLL